MGSSKISAKWKKIPRVFVPVVVLLLSLVVCYRHYFFKTCLFQSTDHLFVPKVVDKNMAEHDVMLENIALDVAKSTA